MCVVMAARSAGIESHGLGRVHDAMVLRLISWLAVRRHDVTRWVCSLCWDDSGNPEKKLARSTLVAHRMCATALPIDYNEKKKKCKTREPLCRSHELNG